jgi:hypothetical protein
VRDIYRFSLEVPSMYFDNRLDWLETAEQYLKKRLEEDLDMCNIHVTLEAVIE